jgi:hypothetical protein
MGFSIDQFNQMQARLSKKPQPSSELVEREIPLHNQIIEWCNSQFPRVKYIRARSDKKSTIGVGVCDFTLFLPKGVVLCVECKSKTGKLSVEQLAFALEMGRLEHKVHLVTNFDEFLELCHTAKKNAGVNQAGNG